jgi:hypothetical protein
MTGGGAGFIFGFVGRTDAASDDNNNNNNDSGGHEVWTSYAADASLLAGLNKTAAQVLAKHRTDAPGMYSLPFDGQSNACYTLVKVPSPPSKVFSLHDTTPLPSQLAGGGLGSAGSSSSSASASSSARGGFGGGKYPKGKNNSASAAAAAAGAGAGAGAPLPRVVFGVIVHAPSAAAAEGGGGRAGPSPEECTRWLETLSELFERKYTVGLYNLTHSLKAPGFNP